jgi:hypothetical protein
MNREELISSEQSLINGYFSKLLEDYYPILEQANPRNGGKMKMAFAFEVQRDSEGGPSKVKMKIRIARPSVEAALSGYCEDLSQGDLGLGGGL